MKRVINKEKVKDLLEKQNRKQTELADFIGIPLSSVSMALGDNDRNISMSYVFEVASFFNVKPLSLTIINDTKTKKIME